MLTREQRAELLTRLRRGQRDGAGQITPRDRAAGPPPASFAQEQLWFIDRFVPGQAAYNIPCVLRLRGTLDPAALSRALGRLTERHETLRTRLVTGEDGRPVQMIGEPVKPDLTPADIARSQVREFIHAMAMRPFDLAAGPPLRTRLVRLTPGEHLLVTVLHHVAFDGWSVGVFQRDLAALYASEVSGGPSGLADLAIQFADYAVWERGRLRDGALTGPRDYWRRTLTGFETLRFPADRPRPVIEDFDGALAERITGPAVLAGLRDLAHAEGTTMFVAFLASMLTLLHRYTGQTDLVVGTVSANRGRGVLAPLIAFLVNTLPIRADLSGDPPFGELMARVKDATVGAFAHQDLPFSELVDMLGVARDAGRPPVFQISIGYAERDEPRPSAAGVEFAVSDLVVGIGAAKYDLTFAAEARREGLWVECSYKTSLFDAATIERLLTHLDTLLRGIVASPRARLSELPMLTGAELRAELTGWNATDGPVPRGCAHDLFEARAASAPDAVAVRYEGERISYADLLRRASQIARRLRELGTGPETLVGVCLRTGPRAVAALIGIWQAGGGYVPLDPDLPAARLAFIIGDTGMTVIVTDSGAAANLPATGTTVLHLDDERNALASLSADDIGGTGLTPANVAYVIYTSGSTGTPKGVVVEHRHVVNALNSMNTHWPAGPGTVALGFAAIAFDASVQDIFLPLTAGGTVVLAAPDTLWSPARLAALLRDERITLACLPPAVLDLLPDGEYPDLRVLMTGGEELPAALARRWTRPGLRLVNVYGPTETTVNATAAELDATTPMPPPIGFPVRPNYRCYVLDAFLNPVPAGVPGELHVGGASVARGYLNRPLLTSERFVDSPHGRLYKTGDLVKRRTDGSLVFLGRVDDQVKIRGIRIEPGEIETALTAWPAIAQAVVTVVTGPAGDAELVAYLRTVERVSDKQVRDHLARTLPVAMIPAHVVMVDTIPLTPNGKVDVGALPPPRRRAARHEPLDTATERMVAGLYATLLGIAVPGASDGFFDLGGNSLTAMRLVDMIGRETGVDLGVTQVFLHPAPRGLAEVIDLARGGERQHGPVIPLTTASTGPPLFLLHAIGGTVTPYLPLSRELADAFTVHGVAAPGLDGAVAASTLNALVADYTRRILDVQPAGPYRLGGWSMGGVLAFEIARRLEQAGARVGALVLLDAPFAAGHAGSQRPRALAARFAADVAQTMGLDASDAPDPRTAGTDAQLGWLAARMSGGPGEDAAAVTARLRRRFDVFAAHSLMLDGYQPVPPPVRAPTLIVAALGSLNAPAREQWPRVLSGPVRVACVDSDHYAFLRPSLVADVAAIMKDWGR